MLDVAVGADPVRPAWLVLRARGRRHLLAARRRGGAAAPSREPGDAALLLADGRVLRRCWRSRSAAGSIALDWVFYWGDVVRDAAAAAALRALRAGVPGAAGQLGAAATPGRTLLPLLYLPGAAARRRARSRWSCAAARNGAVLSRASLQLVERGELLYLALSLVGGLVDHDRARCSRVRSVTARRQLRWIVWGTALGAVPFVLGYALPFALGLHAAAAASSSRRCCSASCRWRSPRRSSATA